MATFKKIKHNQQLEKSAAESAERLFKQIQALYVVSGYRSDAAQKVLFLARYTTTYTHYAPGKVDARRYNGRVYYRKPGFPATAVPGYSNHRKGDTADFGPNYTSFSSAAYKALSQRAPYYGWNNVEGRAVNEPWHWTYVKADDKSLKARGWYHVSRDKTNSYNVKTGKKSATRKRGFNVYADHGTHDGWVVTRHGNRYRLSHLDKGKAPVYRTVRTTVNNLRGRSSPDTKNTKNVKFVRPKGFKLVVRDVPGKPEWVVTRYNTYYWKEFTK